MRKYKYTAHLKVSGVSGFEIKGEAASREAFVNMITKTWNPKVKVEIVAVDYDGPADEQGRYR